MSIIGKKFSFSSAALPADTFDLVSFSGSEGLSKLYRFDVTLVADNDEIDLEDVIKSRATLKILREDDDILFHGILSTFEELETVQERTYYRAVLSPAFWCETLTFHNQIFLDKTIPQIIEAAIKDGGLTSLDYEFRLTGQYQPHEYVCQYNETHHSFVSRLMEREGIYYYFEQGKTTEKIIITDTALLHSVMADGEKMFYSPPSGLDESFREEVIKSLVCCQKMLPAKVILKDYNYRKPSLELAVEAVVSDKGMGDVYIYGEHFPTPEDGQRLAKIRGEALKCRARTFQGESLIPYLRPGYIFLLEGHNRKNFNNSYLTTDITHRGDQSFLFTAGLDKSLSERETSPYYRNSFTAISSEIQYRPERTTEKPRFAGTMHAHIDAAGSGQYAEIDDQGRYKVRLPFDLNSPTGGKASSWIRMAQPYAGDTHGMHFPLHKGTEVLLTFIDGDPDRPIIASAVPNPLTPSPVTSANASQSRITTAGGNKLHIEDQQGSERILLQTPRSNSWIRMGTPNDPPPPTQEDINKTVEEDHKKIEDMEEESNNSGIKLSSTAGFEVECAFENKLVMGESTEITIGSKNDVLLGNETAIKAAAVLDILLGIQGEAVIGTKMEFGRGNVYTNFKENELTGSEKVEIRAGGGSPAVIAAMAAMLVAAAANTAVTAAMGVSAKGNEKAKAAVAKGDVVLTGLITALGAAIASGIISGADALTYLSSIELNATEIELKSPKIKMEGLVTGISMTAVAGGIKSTATLGGISNTAVAGGIKNTATAGGINNTAVEGGIKNTATAGGITNTATEGGITNTAVAGGIKNTATAGGITNTAAEGNITSSAMAGSITSIAETNKLTGMTSVILNSEGSMTVKGGSNILLSSTGAVSVNGAIIKVG